MKSYCWDNKGKEETEKYEFVKKYAEWIEEPQGTCPYKDPDEVGNNPQFYSDITKFLTKQKGNYFDKELEFKEPTKSRKKPGDRTITVQKDENDYLYLTSDQFGFSANKKGIYDEKNHKLNEKYPFVKYVKNGGVKSLVGETIWNTRTIGGSFLWPKVQDNREYWVSTYNTKRGVGNNPVHVDDDFYIEDRVDLTLYEIKEFYEAYIKSKDCDSVNCDSVNCDSVKKNMSKDSLILRYSDSEEIFIWLSLFGTFENYVNFFCFNDFVNNKDDKYYPKDIFSGESINNENIKEYRDKTGKTYKFIQRNACKEDLETAFINLIAWTRARSAKMENIINKTNISDK